MNDKPEEKKTLTLKEIQDELASRLNKLQEQQKLIDEEIRVVKNTLKGFEPKKTKKS